MYGINNVCGCKSYFQVKRFVCHPLQHPCGGNDGVGNCVNKCRTSKCAPNRLALRAEEDRLYTFVFVLLFSQTASNGVLVSVRYSLPRGILGYRAGYRGTPWRSGHCLAGKSDVIALCALALSSPSLFLSAHSLGMNIASWIIRQPDKNTMRTDTYHIIIIIASSSHKLLANRAPNTRTIHRQRWTSMRMGLLFWRLDSLDEFLTYVYGVRLRLPHH